MTVLTKDLGHRDRPFSFATQAPSFEIVHVTEAKPRKQCLLRMGAHWLCMGTVQP